MKKLLKQLKSYKGMDGIPEINKKAYKNMKYIIKKLNKTDFVKPELFPWSDFNGFQLEWDCLGVYLEIDATEEGFEFYYEVDEICVFEYETKIKNKKNAIMQLREFLLKFELELTLKSIEKYFSED